MSRGPTILGIDGGGSKTFAALADRSGTIISSARTGGVNPMDNPAWLDNLNAALGAFTREPELSAAVAAMPVFGEVASLSRAQEAALAAAFGSRPQEVLNDVDAAHYGAFAGGPGILILSGTGSMAWARTADGRSFRVGGWGDQIGDEGSAYWVGQRILSLISQSIDGRAEPTRLVDAVFGHLGLDRNDPLNALEGWVSHLDHPRSGIAALTPLASELASAGDAGAQSVVEAAAEQLARHVTAIARIAGLPLRWSFAGGSFASPALLAAVTRLIGTAPEQPILPPIGGVVLRAANRAGWTTDAAFIDRLAGSIEEQAAENGRGTSQQSN